ncbi:60S ribosomal protein L18 [Binucleata daphniae]
MVPVKTSQLTNTNANKDINNNNNTINNIFVVVAKVLDDDKCVVMPKINLCCLKISKEAKEKIERFGGNVYGLDELFKFDLNDCTLISNDASRRIKCRYYGAPGEKGSNTLIKKMHKKKDVMKRPS